MRLARRVCSGLSTARELVGGIARGPYGWLVPVILFLLPAAIVFAILQAAPLVAPFVYSVF